MRFYGVASDDDRNGPTGDTRSEPFQGVCAGCPSGRPQTVRTVRGDWGVADVCTYHERHDD